MTTPESPRPWEPRPAALWAGLVFVLAAVSLMWPMFTGQFLAGDDQLIAGYAFRDFGATYFKAHGRIPEWNPYLFGGMPFIAAMHGDIFYPTAWLRWLVPTDVGMTLGFFLHLVIAGGAMYALLRGLAFSWTAAVTGGIAYELTGIVASMMRPGHDGKLFVAALAPLAFLALLRAIRHGRVGGFGAFALVIGLAMLSPHYQLTYYLLVASGLFTLWLTFWDVERPRPRAVVPDLGGAALGAALGVGIGMIQGLPFLKYIPFSPRTEGSASSGWDYATSFALPLDELASTVLPQFNGIFELYWGGNFFKTHVEYLGVLVLILAILGLGTAKRRGLLLGFGIVALLFLFVSFGAHTPFYRLWYEVMPMMKKVRAAGMAFFLVALPVAVWAACGVERLLKGEVPARRLYTLLGIFGGLALLGAVGGLQPLAEALAPDVRRDVVLANAGALQAGAIRMLLAVLVGGGVLAAIQARRLGGAFAAAALIVVVGGDNWSVLRRYSNWLPPAAQTYAPDAMITAMQATPMPFRVYDGRSDGIRDFNFGVYQGSWLMAERVPTVLGYHGNEVRFFDELWGTKNVWEHQTSPTLWDLYAVNYITIAGEVELPGFSKVTGPVSFASLDGRRALAGYLYRRDEPVPWVRVVPSAVKVPEAQIIPTVVDPRFPAGQVALFPDTASITGASAPDALAEATPVAATLTAWDAGRMTITLDGAAARPSYLLVAENWAPGWEATIDGTPAPTHRANHALLSVELPAGAQVVELRYHTPGYGAGKLITVVSLLGSLVLVGAGFVTGRRERSDG